MKEYRLGRTEYHFDPTSTQAIARGDRMKCSKPTNRVTEDYYASPEDIKAFRGYTFEPDHSMPNRNFDRGRIRFFKTGH